MTTTTRSTAALALLLTIALALAACGTSSPSASKPPSKAARLASARRSLVVLQDLPTRWKASGSVTAGGGGSGGIPINRIASCLGVPASEVAANPPTENSPTFNDPSGAISVNDEVEAFATTAAARVDYSTFSNAKTPGCVVSILGPLIAKEAKQGAGSGATVGTVTATRHPLAPVGDQSGMLVLRIPVSTAAGSTTLDLTLIVITVGPLETTLTISSVGAPASTSLSNTVAAAAARHMG